MFRNERVSHSWLTTLTDLPSLCRTYTRATCCKQSLVRKFASGATLLLLSFSHPSDPTAVTRRSRHCSTAVPRRCGGIAPTVPDLRFPDDVMYSDRRGVFFRGGYGTPIPSPLTWFFFFRIPNPCASAVRSPHIIAHPPHLLLAAGEDLPEAVVRPVKPA